MRRFTASLVFAFWLLAGLPGPAAFAQVVGAIISGTVTDPSGAVIPNAHVTLRNLSTGVVTQVMTNGTGLYNAVNLLPGDYQVSATAAGFAPQQRSGLSLTVGERQVLNMSLRVGDAAATTFEVLVDPPMVELGSTSVSSLIDGQVARDLPLNGRDWTSLAALEPGINSIRSQPDPNSSLNNRGNRGFGGQVTIAGGRPQQNNYRLDGISVNDYANSTPGSTIGLSLGTDSVQEFSVISNNYSAAYGLTSGGVINAVTRSGGSDFRGSAYEFLRNDVMDARGFFDAAHLPFRRNQFGAALGGPIVKSRLFFFVNYEGLRQSLTTTTIDTVPSPNARNGILCANTQCTQTKTVPVAASVQPYLGLFAMPNGIIKGDTGLYSFASKAVTPEDFGTARLDYNISGNDNLHGTYVIDRGSTTQPDSLNVLSNLNTVNRQVASVEETHVFNASFLNTARGGVNREVALTLATAPGANPLGTDNTLGVVPGLYAPVIQVTGLTSFGGGLNGTSYGNYWFTTYQAYDDAFLTKGIHSLKFGFAFERIDSNFLLAANPDGVYRFNTLSDFLTSKPAAFQFQYGTLTPRGARQSVYGGYVEDDIRLKKDVTLNLGVRYEMSTVPYEVNGKFANLRTLSSTQIDTGGPLFQNPTKKNFEPRVGLAWDPFGTGKTSVRAGFGMFDVLPLTYQFNLAEVSAAPFQSVASSSALPAGSFPSGAVPLVQQASALRTTYIQFNPPRNYVMQWNLTVQREVIRNLTFMAGYVGSRGIHNAERSTDANGVIPTPTQAGFEWPCAGLTDIPCQKTAPRFNSTYGQIDAQEWGGHSYYNALLLSAHRRLTNGLDLQASFTWSKSLDDSSSVGSGGPFANSISGLMFYNPLRGPSDFNVGRSFVLSSTWEIPFARKRFYGGWQLATIVTMNDGLPFTAAISGDALGQANQLNFDVPNRISAPGCVTPVNPGNVQQYIRLSCFAFANPSNLFGNAGRNELVGPGIIDADLALFKNFPLPFINDLARFQVRAEAFNAVNRPNFAGPYANNKLFDVKGNPVAFAGQITTLATPGRVLQMGLKLLW